MPSESKHHVDGNLLRIMVVTNIKRYMKTLSTELLICTEDKLRIIGAQNATLLFLNWQLTISENGKTILLRFFEMNNLTITFTHKNIN